MNSSGTKELLAISGLVVALLGAIWLGMNELAMSIASGLVGYIGGQRTATIHGGENKWR